MHSDDAPASCCALCLSVLSAIMHERRIGCARLGAPAGKPLPAQSKATQAAVLAAVFEPYGLNNFLIRLHLMLFCRMRQ